MAPLNKRDPFGGPRDLSTGALVAILTNVGIVILSLLIGLVWLLFRAVKTHKRLLVDLEQRGVNILTPRMIESSRGAITRPPAVLRRNSFLPFNSNAGWETLSSHETIRNPAPRPSLRRQTTSIATDPEKRISRFPWPFPGRRKSGQALQLKRIRAAPLSAIAESPKVSPLVPILNGPTQGSSSATIGPRSRPSSDQSMLKHHPAFRGDWRGSTGEPGSRKAGTDNTNTVMQSTSPPQRYRPNRSKPVAAIPSKDSSNELTSVGRPKIHGRSMSLGSQGSAFTPDTPMPPLPLEVAGINSEARRKRLITRSPSRFSVSSFESTGSSILVTQSSPIVRPNNLHLQKVTKRHSVIMGPRPLPGTLTSYRRSQQLSQGSIKSSTAQFSTATTPSSKGYSTGDSRPLSLNSASLRAIAYVKASDPARWKRSSLTTPASTRTVRSVTTPRRHLGITVTAFGSPQERRKTSILRNVSSNQGPPTRQLSETSTRASSTRSSNGNPFQWDPAPLQSDKPSALKGSPGARKGHRRQNCVRISLAPTILGTPSRSSSPCPSTMNDIQEESPETAQKSAPHSLGLGFSGTRSLPRPPSSSIFAPDLKLNPTSLRTSLTTNSPTLSLATYRVEIHDSLQLGQNNNQWKRARDSNRLSTSSIFSILTFPSPCHDIGSIRSITSPPPTFAFSRPSNEYVQEINTLDSPVTPSSPFDLVVPDSTESPPKLPGPTAHIEEYDPYWPYLGVRRPATGSPIQFCSAITTFPNDYFFSSSSSKKHARSPSYTPPCSLKTIRLHACLSEPDTQTTATPTFPEPPPRIHEAFFDPVDPALLINDVFTTTTIRTSGSLLNSPTSIPTPNTQDSDLATFIDPLLDAAFPSQSRNWPTPSVVPLPTPTSSQGHSQSELQPPGRRPQSPLSSNLNLDLSFNPTSTYSSPAPPAPSSPRPAHATILRAAPSKYLRLSDSNIPTLSPTPMGPRASPPKDLRRTVAELRRMNSDAETGDRGDRRYLQLGWEESLAALGGAVDDSLWEGSVLEAKQQFAGVLENWGDGVIAEEGESECVAFIAGIADHDEETEAGLPEPDFDLDASVLSKSIYNYDAQEACSFSVWKDGERFWHSTPPRPRESQTPTPSPSPSPSPIQKPAPLRINSTQSKTAGVEKRTSKKSFLVWPDGGATDAENEAPGATAKRVCRTRGSTNSVGNANGARNSTLGMGTPVNTRVSIHVQPPSNRGTPGSLYDADGFLRV